MARELESLGLEVETLPQAVCGDHIVARKPGRITSGPAGQARPVLLIGHLDTVFPRGTAAARPFRVEGGKAFGPGVLDMKGGLTGIVFALKALRSEAPDAWSTLGLTVLLNSDEEIGSPTSMEVIEREAVGAGGACVLEPARAAGEYITRRKGVGTFTLSVEGRAAHAGVQPELGASAILELARKIEALHSLNDPVTGLTVNVGVIRGGERPNVVAPWAECQIDVRAVDRAMMERVEADLRRLADGVSLPGTRAVLSGGFVHSPMEFTPDAVRLFDLLRRAASEIGFEAKGVATGGGSDGNTASQFTPTLDGMGPKGNYAHSPDEFLEVDSLPERTKALARFLELLVFEK